MRQWVARRQARNLHQRTHPFVFVVRPFVHLSDRQRKEEKKMTATDKMGRDTRTDLDVVEVKRRGGGGWGAGDRRPTATRRTRGAAAWPSCAHFNVPASSRAREHRAVVHAVILPIQQTLAPHLHLLLGLEPKYSLVKTSLPYHPAHIPYLSLMVSSTVSMSISRLSLFFFSGTLKSSTRRRSTIVKSADCTVLFNAPDKVCCAGVLSAVRLSLKM